MGAEETKGASSETHGFSFTRMIDLGVGIIPDAPHEPWKPSIRYLTHEREGLDWIKTTFGVRKEDLVHSRGKGAAFEEVTAVTHSGTHADAPWHYGPQSEGKPAKKIDELPIEWFSRTASCWTFGTRDQARKFRCKVSKRRWGVSVTCSSPSTS